jgi:tetratricopeptide (TPR) repeat protein
MRVCADERGAAAVAACRLALARGLGPRRAALVRDMLARQLVVLERWDEALDVRREDAAEQPTDADAQRRWGEALLFYAGRAEDALGAFDAALALKPDDATAEGLKGIALNLLGRFTESVAAFEDALRFEPAWLEARPSASRVLEASRKGERWP